MSGYTFYFHRPDGKVPAFDFADCRDDHEALRAAMRLLDAHSTAERVEVFNGERIIGVAGRSESRVSGALRRMSASIDRSQPAA